MKTKLALAAVAFCLLSTSLLAQQTTPSDLVRVDMTLESIILEPLEMHETYYLTISGQGLLETFVFEGKDLPYIDLYSKAGHPLADGGYSWELSARPIIDKETESAMTWARETGDYSVLNNLRKNGSAPVGVQSQSGYFTVTSGQFLLPETEMAFQGDQQTVVYKGENDGRLGGAEPTNPVDPPAEGGTIDSGEHDGDIDRRDQVIGDDLIVTRSICVGTDCVNGEVFGFDTIKLKENNLRIKFEDTSVGAFPGSDWQLTANDSASGGLNKFSIDDISGSRTPFTIEANSASHSLYVDNGGRVGFGTNIPVTDLHVKDGDSPTLRLEQDGTSGFAPQTWDLAGNETSFFIRDASNGSTLPFRIRPGAASQSLTIDTDNDVGIGILTSSAPLHVFRSNGEARALIQETSGAVVDRVQLEMQNNGGSIIRMENTDSSQSWLISTSGDDLRFIGSQGTRVTFFDSGRITMGTTGSSTSNFDLDAGTGALIIQGSLTEMSDRNSKEDIVPVNNQTILDKVKNLEIAEWSYIDTPDVRHMGPMAQDFRAAFGLGFSDTGLATRDLSAVAVASVKALNEKLDEKEGQIDALSARNEELQAQQASLSAQNQELQERLARIEAALKLNEQK
jgi:hypothetical protein